MRDKVIQMNIPIAHFLGILSSVHSNKLLCTQESGDEGHWTKPTLTKQQEKTNNVLTSRNQDTALY